MTYDNAAIGVHSKNGAMLFQDIISSRSSPYGPYHLVSCIKDFAGVAESPAYDLIYFTDDARI